MGEGNGVFKEIAEIKSDVKEIKDDLSTSINNLSVAVTNLTLKFDAWIRVAENVVPIKVVFWMFALVFVMLAGVEGLKVLLPAIK